MRRIAPALLLLMLSCHRQPRVASAREVGIVPYAKAIQGRDGGNSALLWGHEVWDFGDTALNVQDERGSQWHSNSMSFTDDRDASDGISGFTERSDSAGAPRYFVANTAEEQAFNDAHAGDPCQQTPCGARWAVWPGTLVYDAARDRALIFYGLVYAETGDFNFHGVGQGLAVWSGFDLEVDRPELSPGAEHPTLLFGQDEPDWGAAAVVDGDWLYAFSSSGNALGPDCRLARVALGQATDRTAWRYWDGKAWSPSMADATSLFTCAPIVTVARNDHLGAWVALYSAPLSNEVRLRTASQLTGPWSDSEKAFDADHRASDGYTYDAILHPEYSEQAGKVLYVTFTRPSGVGWFGSEMALERVELE
jgi:hypothetical protein